MKIEKNHKQESEGTLETGINNDIFLPVIDEHVAKAGLTSSLINILNTILGSGMLALPSAISSVGLILGIACIATSGIFAGFGLYILIRCAEYIGRTSSFNAVSQITYPAIAPFFDFAIGIKCFGVGISYLVIIGDLMPDVMKALLDVVDGDLLAERRFWITLFMLIVIPFSFLRRLDSLKYTSFVALIGVLYLFVLTIYFYADTTRVPPPAEDVQLWNPQLKFFKNVPVFVFAFTCHQNIFAIYNELKLNTPARTNSVIFLSIFISASVYLTVGILGYLMFGDKVNQNMLLSFDSSILVTIARIAVTILVASSFPLQCHPSRASFEKIYDCWFPSAETLATQGYAPIEDDSDHDETVLSQPFGPSTAIMPPGTVINPQKIREMSSARFIILTSLIIILSYVIAFFVTDLKTVLGFVGATGSTSICYILPGLFYTKLKEKEKMSFFKLVAYFFPFLGVSIMFIALLFLFVKLD